MSVEENKALAQAFLRFVESADFDPMFVLMDDDCTFWNEHGTLSKSAFRGVVGSMTSVFDGPYAVTIKGMTAEGERVAVETEGSVLLKNGRKYENRYHWLFVVRNGRFVAIREYSDTATAAKAFAAL